MKVNIQKSMHDFVALLHQLIENKGFKGDGFSLTVGQPFGTAIMVEGDKLTIQFTENAPKVAVEKFGFIKLTDTVKALEITPTGGRICLAFYPNIPLVFDLDSDDDDVPKIRMELPPTDLIGER